MSKPSDTGLRSVAELLLGIALLAAGQGASGTLVATRLASADQPATICGLVGAAYFAGMLGGVLAARRAVLRVGPIRAFTAAAAGLTVSLAGLTALEGVWAWLLCRFLAGACMAMVYATTESWLAARSQPADRGRVLAAYTVALYTALSVGQLLVSLPEASGDARRVAAASMLAALGVLPVALTRAQAPAWPETHGIPFTLLLRVAPVGPVACVGAGAMCGALVSLGPLAVVRAGFSEPAVAAFMAGVWGGGLVVQVPVGRASDRWGRRPVLAATGALSALGVTALGIVLERSEGHFAPLGLGLLVAAAAGLAFVFYPLGAAYTLDRVPAEVAAGANRALLLAYAIGSSTGPLIASALMDGFGANALFAFLACIAMTTSVFTLFRLRRFALLPRALRSRVTLVPRTSAVATAMDPRTGGELRRVEKP